MAFTKIQPQQLQLPTFTSPSGDFSFTDLSTGIQINLDRELGGVVNFTHGATVKTRQIITTASTNSIADDCFVLGGSDNEVTGLNNVIINGENNTNVSGNFNTLLNGTQANFGASGQKNTIIAGRLAAFADQTTGAVILADHEGSTTNSTNHSLLVSFKSGMTFQDGEVSFNNNIVHFTGSSSQIHAKNLSIETSLILTDSSEAASQAYVDERVGFSLTESVDNNLTSKLEGADYSYINGVTNLENVLTGTAAGVSDVFTGHVLTGTSVAYFVLQGANFTGALQFSGDAFRAV
tara:strand:- start:3209 stop:4087 length:879 start_codon:yes stop_codon:yes gene_type:complete